MLFMAIFQKYYLTEFFCLINKHIILTQNTLKLLQ